VDDGNEKEFIMALTGDQIKSKLNTKETPFGEWYIGELLVRRFLTPASILKSLGDRLFNLFIKMLIGT
jgi:hypothetical protein